MPAKASSRAKPKTSRAKVVNNKNKSSGFSSLWQSRKGAVMAVLAFVLVGASTIVWAQAATTTSSLWTNSAVPKTITDSDSVPVELGTKFKAKYTGEVQGVKFYKGPQNTGTHIGNLWSSDGRKLASVTFKNESVSGWQTATFATPVQVAANTSYVISYFAPKGHYSVNEGYFTQAMTNDPLTASKNGGVYAYGTSSTYPRASYKASNYWVDVVFSTKLFNPTPKPAAPTSLTATLSGTTASLTWQYSTTTGINRYQIFRDGTLIKDNVTGQNAVDAGLSTGKTYTYTVRAMDDSGQASDLSNSAKVVVPAPSTGGGTTTPTPPTPPTTPEPPITGGSSNTSCPLPKYPNEGCTGNHTATTTSASDLTIDAAFVQKNGPVVDGYRVSGSVNIRTNGVTIKNSSIAGPVTNDSGSTRYSFTIEDSTVGSSSVCNSYGNGAIGVSNYTARRVRVLNFPDGFRVAGSNTIIEDSYVTTCSTNKLDHSDGIQVYGAEGGTNISIRHNTVDETHVTNGAANAAIFFPGDGDRQGNNNAVISITDNMIAGGGYTMYVPGPGSPVTITAMTGNKVVNGTWEYAGFGVECSFVKSAGNNAIVTYDFTSGTILSTVRQVTDCQ